MKRLRDAWNEIVAGVETYREGVATGSPDKWNHGWDRAKLAMLDQFAPSVKRIEPVEIGDPRVNLYLDDLQDFVKDWPADGRLFEDRSHDAQVKGYIPIDYWGVTRDYIAQAVQGIERAHKAGLLK